MSTLAYSGAEPQPSLAWQFQSSNADSVTGLTPSSQVSPGPTQLRGSAALVTNAPTSNTAVYFPGTVNDYMNLGTSTPTNFNYSTSNVFLECWVYFNDLSTIQRIFHRNFSPTFRTNNSKIGFASTFAVEHPTILQTQRWYHLAASAVPGVITCVFVDGNVQTGGAMVWTSYSSADSTLLGSDTTRYFNGYIRDLRVVQGGVVPVANFTPLASAPFSYASPTYVANMGTTVFTLLGQFVTYNPSGKYGSSIVLTSNTTARQYITYTNNDRVILNPSSGITISCWVEFITIQASGQSSFVGLSGTTAGIYINWAPNVMQANYYNGTTYYNSQIALTPVIGTWYHLVCVMNSTSLIAYVNGVSGPVNSYAIPLDASSTISLGSQYGALASFELDDLRIYNTALTAAQVASVYSSQGAPAPSRAMPLPRLAWTFDGTTTDYVQGLTGTTTGTVSYNSSGKYGQSLVITNTPGLVASNYVSYSTPYYPSTLTTAVWLKLNTIGVASQYFAEFAGTSGGISYVILINSNNTVAFRVQAQGGVATTISTVATVTAGQWYHIAAVIDGYNQTIYLNGVLAAGPSPCNTLAFQYRNITLGGSTSNAGRVLVNGELDDLRIFNTALTAAQVQAVFSEQGMPGRGVTAGPQPKIFLGPLLTYPPATGTPPTSDGTKVSFARASSQYLNYGSQTFDMSKGFSATCRFAFTSTVGNWERIFDFGSGTGVDNILLTRQSGTGNILFSYRNGGTEYPVLSTNTVAQGQINTVTAIYTPSPLSIKIVLNDITTTSTPAVAATTPRTLTICYVGESNWGADAYLNGDIYSLNIYNRALTANELSGPPAPSPWGIFTATPNGLTSAQAATSGLALKQGYPGYGDGVYWINCGGVPKQTYCLMNSKWDGGGWMLIMKAAQGSTFNWGSTHWTTTSTLNPTDTTTTVADAKFDVFNSVPVTDVMAVWPTSDIGAGNTGGSLTVTDGWVWLVKNWYTSSITPLAGFQIDRDATPADIFLFSGFSTTSPIWSYQSGLRAHVFGSGAHIAGPDYFITRWGFLWNNEVGTTNSQDAFAGIGLNSPSSSGGDFYFWVGTQKKGFNRNIAWLMYGR